MRQLSIILKTPKISKEVEKVFAVQKSNLIPEKFRFLGIESVLILGYGKEGKVTEKFLKKYYPEIKIGIADQSQGKDYLKNIKNYDVVIKTPGIPRSILTVKTRAPESGARGIKKDLVSIYYTTATNIFFSEVRSTIIGVTGSKGKSTTASLIFHILKSAGKNVQLLGNIGNPMLQALLKPIKKNTIFVLELSSAQLEDIKFSPDIAVATNLFAEHMDYHGNVEKYYEAKKNIIRFQKKGDLFVYNPEKFKIWLKDYKGRAIPFTDKIPLRESEIPLIGSHNLDNIMAAFCVARILKIPENIIKIAVKSFKGLPHRLNFVGEFKGIKFYDDGSSTNPESAVLAVKSIKNINTIMLGGEDRGYDFSNLEKVLKKYKIKNIVLFPDSGKKIIKSKIGFNILYTDKMEEAVKFAYENTEPGKVCLLSGASPSYSLWKNFEEKGNQFQYFVKKYGKSLNPKS